MDCGLPRRPAILPDSLSDCEDDREDGSFSDPCADLSCMFFEEAVIGNAEGFGSELNSCVED